MMYTKAELEELINNSPLFSIDKEKEEYSYKIEKRNLLNLIFTYYRVYFCKTKKLEEYSLPLMETAVECIKYYAKDKGPFINLLNSVMKRNAGIFVAKNLSSDYRHGIKIRKKDEILIHKIIRYARSKNLDFHDAEIKKKIANVMKLSIKRVDELIYINENATAVSSIIINEDGDDIQLIDIMENKDNSILDILIGKNKIQDIMDSVNSAFLSIQDRQKELLSMLLTTRVIKWVSSVDCEVVDLCKYSFINEDMMLAYNNNNKILTVREIASICKTSEQNASRAYKNFVSKILIVG